MDKKKKNLLVKCLYYYWKMIGLCPYGIVNQTLQLSISEFIIVVMRCLLYSYVFISLDFFRLKDVSSVILIVGYMSVIVEAILILCVWIISASQVKKVESVRQNFVRLHNKLVMMGLETQSAVEILQDMALHCFYINSFFYVHVSIVFTLVADSVELSFRGTMYQFARVVVWNTVVLFVEGVLLIRKKFQVINNAIRNFSDFRTRNEERQRKWVFCGSRYDACEN